MWKILGPDGNEYALTNDQFVKAYTMMPDGTQYKHDDWDDWEIFSRYDEIPPKVFESLEEKPSIVSHVLGAVGILAYCTVMVLILFAGGIKEEN